MSVENYSEIYSDNSIFLTTLSKVLKVTKVILLAALHKPVITFNGTEKICKFSWYNLAWHIFGWVKYKELKVKNENGTSVLIKF